VRRTVALVVAAGTGQRFGSDVPKQYLPLAGGSVLRRAVAAFLHHPRIDGVQVVIAKGQDDLYAQAIDGLSLLAPVAGGPTRQSSVRLGLERMAADPPDQVLVHDAGRPLVSAAVIDRVLDALDCGTAAIAAVPVTDTLKRMKIAAGGLPTIGETVDRSGLWAAQTPQGFPFAPLLDVHRRFAERTATDDAALFEAAGLPVALVPGEPDNIKVTMADDLARAERLLGLPDVRTGLGYDVHAFGAGDHVMLCGVRVPHDRGVIAHSDGDVGLHALTDALLGAIGAGDIGQHFPPSDPRWRGASSDRFLRHAADLVAARGGRITNVDVTVVCERPKIGPHRDAMVTRMAAILGIAPDRVSVKATTSERLGFTGRSEGLAAQAIATLVLA
jgi:2-C-methyl-D-erythritol 4-phosphate cytidylyltransferase / 2-C-methyl-D-erythritol 2,4-cyclodiphosphate synthase